MVRGSVMADYLVMIPHSAESKVVFLCDAGREVGGGHVMRCLTLAAAVGDCAFVETPEVAAILDVFAPGMARVASPDGAGVLVLDHYRMGLADETALRGKVGRLVVLDDLARPHDCDLVVDPSFGRRAEDYTVPALVGPDYALVRPQFAAAGRVRSGPVRRALISLGLTDVGGITDRVVKVLPEGMALDVTRGRTAPEEMAALMAAADVAVGAGGSSVWERACAGLPSITLILADNQRDMAMKLDEAGATLALDARWPGLEGRLLALWKRLVGNEGLRASLSERSSALCDGRGAERVAAALEAL